MMGMRLHLTGNVHDLARQLEKICQEIPQKTTRVLYDSIAWRMTACIQARGTGIRGFSSGRPPGTTPADDRYIFLQARETGGRQREKSLDTRHRRLDDRYRVFRCQKTARWWSVSTTPCTVCTFNACTSEKAFSVVPGTPELERQ
ncbi:hypothetical protein TNCV_4380871 [Trichonephila clavipes]|nr:hypothetical protein TNCV_4380871 [Trichonephila clavipes]